MVNYSFSSSIISLTIGAIYSLQHENITIMVVLMFGRLVEQVFDRHRIASVLSLLPPLLFYELQSRASPIVVFLSLCVSFLSDLSRQAVV